MPEPRKEKDRAVAEARKDKDKSADKDRSGEKGLADGHKDKEKSGEKVGESRRQKDKDAAVARGDTLDYEVQSNDTFSSISRKELGSVTFWSEIKRLNPDVDPSRMKLGMRLRLPSKRPLADTVAAGESRRH